MYTGTKKGTIFMHDLRGHFAHSQSDMTHKFGIAHIYLASDELSLTASDTSGKVSKIVFAFRTGVCVFFE